MFFEEKDVYLNLFYLEKVYSKFYNELFSMEYGEESLIFVISLIEKFIETFPLIEIIVYYDNDESENPFLVKFPNVGQLDTVFNENTKSKENIEKREIIVNKLDYIDNENLRKKYFNSHRVLEEKIKVKYIIKNENCLNIFKRCYDSRNE